MIIKNWKIKLKKCPYCDQDIDIIQSGVDKQSTILRLIYLSEKHITDCSDGSTSACVSVSVRERVGNLVTYKVEKIII